MVKKEKLTPMLKQYMEIKENTKDALVFYRLGDFYELFFEDAITAAKVLDLVLTQRSAGGAEKAPMCGVPHHAAKSYINKLVANGYKVAIVEQVEDPKDAVGIVKREVVEIVTPGTSIEQEDLINNEIAAIHADLIYATIVLCDIVSGSLRSIRVLNQNLEILKTLEQFEVRELVVDSSFDENIINDVKDKTSIHISYEDGYYKDIKHEDSLVEKALQKLFSYLQYTQKRNLNHFREVVLLNDLSYLKMDYSSMNNLELLQQGGNKDLSLYSFLNHTKTNMGARALKEALLQPMVLVEDIKERQDQIEYLQQNFMLRDNVIDGLKNTYDIHRVIARLTTDKNNAQDFVRLKKTIEAFNTLKDTLSVHDKFDFIKSVDGLEKLFKALDDAIMDDAPVQLKEGRTFKPGVDDELDDLLEITKNGKQWLVEYEQKQREITDIKNLKVGYTRAFGYYIEISKGQVDNVKEEFGFIRKQTLTNAERYISADLQEYETKVVSASERILEIENMLMKKFTSLCLEYTNEIQEMAQSIAKLDLIQSLEHISSYPGYVKPVFNNNNDMNIVDGRHPVLEKELSSHQYIASDVLFGEDRKLLILTGPNMGGKSTYLRMSALIVILAQMGAFVPASHADLGIVDQIFTRMGASDDILMGQSTFMVEMMEAQTALSKASKNSLVLFDEIGRGTSTYDGMAIAQSILEYMVTNIGCNTIFSTHYHELTELENIMSSVKNIHVEAHAENNALTFLYRVIEGSAKRSYGINVARLANLPQALIQRASQNLEVLEAQKHNVTLNNEAVFIETVPKAYTELVTTLNAVDMNQMTPLEALMLLTEIKANIGDANE
ncbi:MAG: DNA mismatch repair protein MutS [Erysipelothrix sp.]|nr:DNA mismatch repair protein MutS [Erysipelothrix sp.]